MQIFEAFIHLCRYTLPDLGCHGNVNDDIHVTMNLKWSQIIFRKRKFEIDISVKKSRCEINGGGASGGGKFVSHTIGTNVF